MSGIVLISVTKWNSGGRRRRFFKHPAIRPTWWLCSKYRCSLHVFLSNCNETPRKPEVYALVFRGVSFYLGAEKLILCMYVTYTPICASWITIFVKERERGHFNRAHNGASGEPRESKGSAGEYARALGEPHGALPWYQSAEASGVCGDL